MKHSRGPWVLVGEKVINDLIKHGKHFDMTIIRIGVENKGVFFVGSAVPSNISMEELVANIKLMVDAPELYAALEQIVKVDETEVYDVQARNHMAAIARAATKRHE